MVDEPNELHILLIEDNEGDADLFRAYLDDLRGSTFRISHVTKLGQGIDCLINEDVDLVILDLMLPDATGIGSIERIHSIAPRTPVVILSGVADESLGQRAIQAGAQDFLHKDELDAQVLSRSLRYATERVRLQSQFRSLVEHNADAIVVIDHEGIVTFLNQAAESLFGRDRDDMVGEPFGFPIAGDGMWEMELRRPDDEVRFAEMRVVTLDWEGNSAWLASIRDITDRKRAEELQRRLYQVDRLASIGQLASGVAHEVNNPANFILNNLDALRENLAIIERGFRGLRRAAHTGQYNAAAVEAIMDELSIDAILAEVYRMLDHNLVGIERISKIVKSLSSFSRIEQDEVELVDINEVLDAACAMTYYEIRHRADLRKELGQIPKIPADRGKLAQVFTNLLINAAHSISPGSADKNQIQVATCTASDEVVVRVKDTGCGIAEDTLNRIFDPFFTTKKRGQGTGLGLSLSADIVRKHGGHIRVNSVLGQGSCFEVVLPMETGMALPVPKAPPKARELVKTRARVLVIDDEPMLLESLYRMLRRSHEVVLAEGGVAAVSELEQSATFDVLICDLMMPEIDGIKLYKLVSERWPDLRARIIFCSGGAFTPDSKAFIGSVSNVNVVVEKPIRQATLLQAVARVIEQHGYLGSLA